MTSYDNYSAYTPVEVSTPPRSRQATPVSTPSRAALLKQTFTPRGSPIKFSLDKLEKTALRDIEFDPDYDEPQRTRFSVGRFILWILGLSMWLLLIASDIYMSVLYIQTAALGVTWWSSSLKGLFRFGMIVITLSTGFSIGYVILHWLKFPSSPWRTSLDHTRRLIVNWIMFFIFIVGVPVTLTVVPLVVGPSGRYNPQYQAWNNACLDSQFTSMIQIKYSSPIGYAYSMTMYARDTNGTYHYLGLLPSSSPGTANVILTTPNFILSPTTNPITPAVAAGQRMFSITGNTSISTQLIASLELNATSTGGQSIQAQCTNTTNQSNNLTLCINGFLTSSAQVLAGDDGSNPLLSSGNQTKTLEIMYDTVTGGNNSSNSTFLRGFNGTWPSESTHFMTSVGGFTQAPGASAADQPPAGVLEEFTSNGVSVGTGVQVVNSPWPGCDGLRVCGTDGINALLAAGWIWEQLFQWEWYSVDQCENQW